MSARPPRRDEHLQRWIDAVRESASELDDPVDTPGAHGSSMFSRSARTTARAGMEAAVRPRAITHRAAYGWAMPFSFYLVVILVLALGVASSWLGTLAHGKEKQIGHLETRLAALEAYRDSEATRDNKIMMMSLEQQDRINMAIEVQAHFETSLFMREWIDYVMKLPDDRLTPVHLQMFNDAHARWMSQAQAALQSEIESQSE